MTLLILYILSSISHIMYSESFNITCNNCQAYGYLPANYTLINNNCNDVTTCNATKYFCGASFAVYNNNFFIYKERCLHHNLCINTTNTEEYLLNHNVKMTYINLNCCNQPLCNKVSIISTPKAPTKGLPTLKPTTTLFTIPNTESSTTKSDAIIFYLNTKYNIVVIVLVYIIKYF